LNIGKRGNLPATKKESFSSWKVVREKENMNCNLCSSRNVRKKKKNSSVQYVAYISNLKPDDLGSGIT